MAQEWFYKFMGETVGPLSTSEFREHAADGRVQPDSLVTRDGTDDWVSADRIKGLFDSEGVLLLKVKDNVRHAEDEYEEAQLVADEHEDEKQNADHSRDETSSRPDVYVDWRILAGVGVCIVIGVVCFQSIGDSESTTQKRADIVSPPSGVQPHFSYSEPSSGMTAEQEEAVQQYKNVVEAVVKADKTMRQVAAAADEEAQRRFGNVRFAELRTIGENEWNNHRTQTHKEFQIDMQLRIQQAVTQILAPVAKAATASQKIELEKRVRELNRMADNINDPLPLFTLE
jgi:hypothetical protein